MFKQTKGITLIALIITIVVLLILAGVTINMVMGENGLFNKSKTSVAKYENAQEMENSVLSGYENEIDRYINGNRTVSEAEIEAVVNRLMLNKYPVGSIYCSVSDTDPGTFIGGTWTKISQGRVLMGASDNAEDGFVAGTTKNAGLPNITGSVYRTSNEGSVDNQFDGHTGALYSGSVVARGMQTSSSNYGVLDSINFDASLSNSIYGASNTVQPPAYVVYMWQRIE